MFRQLDSCPHQGSFVLAASDSLAARCNAPADCPGIYLVWADTADGTALIYVGCSGRQEADGRIRHRQGGIRDRLVNGKQFGQARRKSWPLKMAELGFHRLIVRWYDTAQADPHAVERALLDEYRATHHRLPLWNKI